MNNKHLTWHQSRIYALIKVLIPLIIQYPNEDPREGIETFT
jgi:hypothetical protein